MRKYPLLSHTLSNNFETDFVTVHQKVDEQHAWKKLCNCNTFEDISHLLTMLTAENLESGYYTNLAVEIAIPNND